jgi:hypothetical protein
MKKLMPITLAVGLVLSNVLLLAIPTRAQFTPFPNPQLPGKEAQPTPRQRPQPQNQGQPAPLNRDPSDTLQSGSRLQQSSTLRSKNRAYSLVIQSDCNLVLYNFEHRPLWSSGTEGQGSNCYAEMQTDGNLVVYADDRRPVWGAGTEGNPGATLVVQDDGNVVVQQGRALWATGTDPVVLTERCSGDVFISDRYDATNHPKSGISEGGLYLTRGQKPSASLSAKLSGETRVDQRRIRWWCNSTKGNWADPGTWRVSNGYIEVGCGTDLATGEAKGCTPGKSSIGLASSAVGDWTPERSACPYPVRAISARLDYERLLEIRCLR